MPLIRPILFVFALIFPASLPMNGGPVTWSLVNLTFHPGLPATGPGGPITATGTFVYDADISTMLSWNISVTGAADPDINFTFTPLSSFIPAILFPGNSINATFVRTLPGNPPENVFGTNPFDSHSVLLDLNFFSSPGNLGLSNPGGAIDLRTGGTQLRKIATNEQYGVETGCATAGAPCANEVLTPEPGSMLAVGMGLLTLSGLFKKRRSEYRSKTP